MAWTHPRDTDQRHRGTLLGRLADGTVPLYRTNRAALYEREFRDSPHASGGNWTGPEPGRPTEQPAALIPACRCGWRGPDLPYDPTGGRRLTLDGENRHNDQDLTAYNTWHTHADAALDPALPDVHREWLGQLAEQLRELTGERPRAALTLARQLRELADLAEPLAIAHALAHNVPWDAIGADLGRSKQNIRARYRRPSRGLTQRVHRLTGGLTVEQLITAANDRTPHSPPPGIHWSDAVARIHGPDPADPDTPHAAGPRTPAARSGQTPGFLRAENELLTAAEPFIATGGHGLAHATYRTLRELRAALARRNFPALPQARTATAALGGRSIKIPDNEQGRRLRAALTTYAAAYSPPHENDR
ncbi:hypothetical protein [Streptomyces sp. NPDC050485]|uniref:hypothetical protein n=1 Tax=Streptomyces sp. NPDC050485 TaxID=3365617 RepID=UPI00378A8C07